MDAFFASVEVLDRPELARRPVVVGGTGARGVVASCTYEARAYGIRSAMPSVRARQLCPHAVFLEGRFRRYAEVSSRLRTILVSVTPLVEPVGLDEAFLDVTGARQLLGGAPDIAWGLRSAVSEGLGLGCSIGVGRSKLMAKLASRAAKPVADRRGTRQGRGVVVVDASTELDFLGPLPVEVLWGVGPATARRLHELGARTVGQLAGVPERTLCRRFGQAHGRHLAALARGEDGSPVVPDRPAKSMGHERTFPRDVHDRRDLRRHVTESAQAVASQLRSGGVAGRTVTVKVRFADFSTVTRSRTLAHAIDTEAAISAAGRALLDAVPLDMGVRLLGLSVAGLRAAEMPEQLAFELGPDGVVPAGAVDAGVARLQHAWSDVAAAVDAVRERFGRESVGTADGLRDEGLTVPELRSAPWGPSAERPPPRGATPAQPPRGATPAQLPRGAPRAQPP